ncbi:hypothetical protein JHK82_039600 [Glycine max]|nr:hypothetical protein JHK82_039600 [Glycine max]
MGLPHSLTQPPTILSLFAHSVEAIVVEVTVLFRDRDKLIITSVVSPSLSTQTSSFGPSSLSSKLWHVLQSPGFNLVKNPTLGHLLILLSSNFLLVFVLEVIAILGVQSGHEPYFRSFVDPIKEEPKMNLYGTTEVKVEDFSNEPPQLSQINLEETYNEDMVKEEEGINAFPSYVASQYLDVVENGKGKRPKYEHDDDPITCLEPSWVEETVDEYAKDLVDPPLDPLGLLHVSIHPWRIQRMKRDAILVMQQKNAHVELKGAQEKEHNSQTVGSATPSMRRGCPLKIEWSS